MRAHPVPVARPRGQARRRRPDEHADGRRQAGKRPRRRRHQERPVPVVEPQRIVQWHHHTGPGPASSVQVRRAAQVRHVGQGHVLRGRLGRLQHQRRDARPAQGRRRRRGRSGEHREHRQAAHVPTPRRRRRRLRHGALRRRGPLPHQPRRRPVRLHHDGPDGHARRRQHVPGALLPQPLAAVAGPLRLDHRLLPAQRGPVRRHRRQGHQRLVHQHGGRGVEPGEAPRELLPAVRGRARQEDALLRGHEPRAVPARLDARVQVPRLQRRLGARALRHQRRRRRRRRLRLRHVLGPRARPRHVGAADRRWKPLQRVLFFARSDTQRAQAATQTQPPTTQAPNP